ncbi:MAG: adenosylmethionine decarboxylase [Corynebacteriales bacterium]|nr:adenosylmethionine decarboxylase [Mycobacteriales bacterium]
MSVGPAKARGDVGDFVGAHCLAEFAGAPAHMLDDEIRLREMMERILREFGATVCDVTSKSFVPQGVTVLALLSESHASIHTYPERQAAFVDVFTCGGTIDPEAVCRAMAAAVGANIARITTIARGAAHENADR